MPAEPQPPDVIQTLQQFLFNLRQRFIARSISNLLLVHPYNKLIFCCQRRNLFEDRKRPRANRQFGQIA